MKKTILIAIFWIFSFFSGVISAGELKIRDGLPNFFHAVQHERFVKVAYLGGSITAAGDGWRELTCNWLRVHYPETVFSHVNAGIGGTGSDLGAFRVEDDVIKTDPDLVFVEFAVNDGGRPVPDIIKSIEGIVRKIWRALPGTDICFVYTIDEGKFLDFLEGKLPNSVVAMEHVAEHYGIPSINFADRLKPLYESGRLIFTAPREKNVDKIVMTSDRVHPLSESGHPLYAASVAAAVEEMEKLDFSPAPHVLSLPADPENWSDAKMLVLSQMNMSGWDLMTDGIAQDISHGSKASFYRGRPGSTLSFEFKGTVLGLYDILGPKSAKLRVTVDDSSKVVTRFDKYCSYDRLASTIVFDGLEDVSHSVTIEVLSDDIDKISILSEDHKRIFASCPEKFNGKEYCIGAVLIVGDLVDDTRKPFSSSSFSSDSLWTGERTIFHPYAQPVETAATLYVRQGSKVSAGTLRHPFSTLEEAFERAGVLVREQTTGPGAIEIVLTGDEYRLTGPIRIGKEHSGSERNPVVFRSADRKKPVVITGGAMLLEWEKETDPSVLDLLPEHARGKVLRADFGKNGIAGITEIVFGGFGSGRSHCGTYRFDTMPVPELYYDGEVQEFARWPDSRDTVEYVFGFSDPRAEKWGREDDVWLHGYWKYLYADSYEKIGGFSDGRLELVPPYNRYGFSDTTKGLITESRWYALNLLSEMDRPGEWKISADRKSIWFFPPEKFDSSKCILSAYGPGFLIDSCSNLTFRNIEISHVKGDAVVAENCDRLTFSDCNIHDVSGLGIQILGGRYHLIRHIDICDMGRGGVYLQSGDKRTLEPSHSVIENCHIRNLSRIDRTYTPAVLLDGVAITVQNCLFEEIPSSAIRMEGNDMLVQMNEFADCVLESNDQGAIDIWFNSLYRGNVIRWNYFHDIGSEDRMAAAVRLDDAISGVVICGNIMQNCSTGSFGAVQVHGGHYNCIEDNIFIDNNTVVSNTAWPDDFWVAHFRNPRTVSILKETPWRSGRWRKYPELRHLYDNPNFNVVRNNIFIDCGEIFGSNSFNVEANKIKNILFSGNRNIRSGKPLKNPGEMVKFSNMEDKIPADRIGLLEK